MKTEGTVSSILDQQTTNPINEGHVTSDFRLLIDGRLVEGAGTLERDQSRDRAGPDRLAPGGSGPTGSSGGRREGGVPGWSATPIRERGELLVKLADALEAEQDEFARLLTEEQGKPLPHAQSARSPTRSRTLRYFAALDLPLEVLKEDATQKVVRQRKPLGVVAAITPWNFPVLLLMFKVPPALLAGNTVVAKPAPTTPLTTLQVRRALSPRSCRRASSTSSSTRTTSGPPSPATPMWPRSRSPARPRPARR